jgi:amino-acid N-acetyltransferase
MATMENMEKILAITLSGVRCGERMKIIDLLTASALHTADITEAMLRNFVVARKGDKIVGVIGLEIAGSDALVRSLAVHADFRHQGVAAMLTTAIERYGRSCGIDMLYLLTLTAEPFFAEQGYERSDRRAAPSGMQATREFQSLCPDTAVCMRKRIKRP